MLATRVLMAAKRSTGIVGLPVVENAREVLIEKYTETLEKLKEVPSGVPYRESVEQITNYRLSVVQKFEDSEQIEKEIDCGQLEELLAQAKDELALMEMLKSSSILQPTEK
ncbi:NADH dehydrogenase ubiquinone 1 alpha subcomplex subunit 5 [Hondaea fermentalgiana]|uniref:NADH dehydrogenase ubiquinone 1 alpha subcomplex subunit 5 n=1 Tax=Hondaea fermentalgiana TaxID=2315210 RepID=A0A2R5GVC8_9STRA|nr:NADH dehydrogenase ubiquinone 1 alpha subcomplex subunit 5 [Hondaea fermentalgiana]|eukprot:GBG34797.1 NADH dehydrogenase ubiquinone 1 alpha subcomplex subunit 5 [Hondaea fermentalgiana]